MVISERMLLDSVVLTSSYNVGIDLVVQTIAST